MNDNDDNAVRWVPVELYTYYSLYFYTKVIFLHHTSSIWTM